MQIINYFADGKEYDAYVSVGKSTADMKFIQRNIVDVLQIKYNYKFYVDDENLLPQLGENCLICRKNIWKHAFVTFFENPQKGKWCLHAVMLREAFIRLIQLKTNKIVQILVTFCVGYVYERNRKCRKSWECSRIP